MESTTKKKAIIIILLVILWSGSLYISWINGRADRLDFFNEGVKMGREDLINGMYNASEECLVIRFEYDNEYPTYGLDKHISLNLTDINCYSVKFED